MRFDNNTQAFFELVKAGLWVKRNPNIRINGAVDWNYIYQLAQEQSVQGLVLAGLEQYKNLNANLDLNIPKVLLLQWIGEVQIIEKQNKDMNAFIAELIEKLRKEDIYAILVKGQGIAQCYEKPLWRSCGDVDLLLSENNYQKAKKILQPLAISHEEEYAYTRHLGMNLYGWEVELHGNLRGELSNRIDKELDDIANNIFSGGIIRSWHNDSTQVFLPGIDDDAIFIFTHIIQHFFKGGIGLRQICDWCRLLYTYRESLNYGLLEKRIRKAGIMTEWKAFAAFAVDYLGMPGGYMPLYDDSNKWKQKAVRIFAFVLETGNFGHNRFEKCNNNKAYLIRKIKSLWNSTKDSLRHFFIFPLDSTIVWWRMFIKGVAIVVKEKWQKS